jgi:hypothetical protein
MRKRFAARVHTAAGTRDAPALGWRRPYPLPIDGPVPNPTHNP